VPRPTFRCDDCTATFDSDAVLQDHRREMHRSRNGLSLDERIDEEVEGSFPASDPPSSTPVQGVGGPAEPARPLDDAGR
jgi:hypothetical protein